MYAKSENIGDARNAFDGMTAKSVVSWNTVVVAYGQHGNGKEAMKFLQAMLREFFAPDELTLASVLSSCGSTSNCCQIMQIHAHIVKIDFQSFLSVGNAMINAYSKCGRIASALKCFNSIPEPNLVTWTSIICAYAFNSPPKDSIEMFEKMLSAGVRPDKIAFLGVLSACSHAGLIKEGLHYFRLMVKHYHFFPDSEHYGCLIDLFGRAGLLDEAFNVLTTIPIEYRSDTLGAFIGACKIHKDVISAKWAMEKLLELKPHVPVNYALMSNMYANEGQWHDVAKVRKLMRDRCDHKVPGFSWMELGGDIHMFVSSDKCHPQGLEVYCMLGRLFGLMRDENTISKLHAMQENLLDECAL
ncbi:hypothetical protein JCGZ_14373 [Jatropha curcas]|uniref:Pentatricopeptide repeat-containing protein n=2 Tax=Jatropha curcas TaxID=180498 RepID=A0A067JXH9_JATCU|nr:hypothetical protein JCGZ_14373 [Jatropha curcas]